MILKDDKIQSNGFLLSNKLLQISHRIKAFQITYISEHAILTSRGKEKRKLSLEKAQEMLDINRINNDSVDSPAVRVLKLSAAFSTWIMQRTVTRT